MIRELCYLLVSEELRVSLVFIVIVLTMAPKLYGAAKTFFFSPSSLPSGFFFLAFQQVLCWLTDLGMSWKAFAAEDKDVFA